MSTFWILLLCIGLSGSMTLLFIIILACGARRNNRRKHELARWLACSHPEWN